MRALVVTPWFPNDRAPGSGIFNRRDVELLARNHDVSVLHLVSPGLMSEADSEGWVVQDGYRVRRVPYALTSPRTWGGAVRAIREEARGADLVHSMALPALRPVTRAKVGLPWLHTEHWSALVSPSPSPGERLGRMLFARDLARPDLVIAVGTALAGAIDGFREEPTRVIGNRVMTSGGALPRELPADLSGRVRLIGVGGLVPRKGAIPTVDMVRELVDAGIDAHLSWVGVGAQAEEFSARASELGVSDRVEMLGQLTPEKLQERLLASNVFVLPTEAETFGVAIAEALGHGLPVITSGTGGHLEFLPAEASRVVTERTGRSLARALRELAADERRWSAAEIQGFAEDRFAEAVREREYERAYQDVFDART